MRTKMARLILAAALLLLLAHPAWAATPNEWLAACDGTDTADATRNMVNDTFEFRKICHKSDESLNGASAPASEPFDIETLRASCNLERDINGTSGTAIVELRVCPTGSSTRNTSTCSQIIRTFSTDGDATLWRGEYLLVFTTLAAAGEDAVWACEGLR